MPDRLIPPLPAARDIFAFFDAAVLAALPAVIALAGPEVAFDPAPSVMGFASDLTELRFGVRLSFGGARDSATSSVPAPESIGIGGSGAGTGGDLESVRAQRDDAAAALQRLARVVGMPDDGPDEIVGAVLARLSLFCPCCRRPFALHGIECSSLSGSDHG